MDTTTDPTPQQILDLPLDPDNDSGATTVRGYLVALLVGVWEEEEGFDGKRPFGNSGWECDLHIPLIKAGMIDGAMDEDGYLDRCDCDAGNKLILAAIKSFGGAA